MDTTCALAEDYPDIIKAIKKEAEQGGDGDAEEAV
jgi:hypothetical protein